jgi:hypothetical protein
MQGRQTLEQLRQSSTRISPLSIRRIRPRTRQALVSPISLHQVPAA